MRSKTIPPLRVLHSPSPPHPSQSLRPCWLISPSCGFSASNWPLNLKIRKCPAGSVVDGLCWMVTMDIEPNSHSIVIEEHRRTRERPINKHQPVVLMTANDLNGILHLTKHGANVGLWNFSVGLWNFPGGLCKLDCETCQSDCETCIVKLEMRILKL